MRRTLLILVALTAAVTLAGTLTGSAALGWIGVAGFVLCVVVYVRWRREVRRGRVFDREA